MRELEYFKKDVAKFEYNGNNDQNNTRFPIEIFPDDIAYILKSLKKQAGFEEQITASTYLFAVSTIIGNSKTIEVKGDAWKDTPNLWIAIVGKRGTTKSPAISYILKPLKNHEKEFANMFDTSLSSYYKTPKKDRNEHEKPKRRQRFTNDTTIEGLIDAMQYNWNGIGIYKDELNGFFEEMNRYNSGGALEFYLTAFNGGVYLKNRKTYDPQTVNDIYLSMLGSIQPEVLRNVSKTQTQNGMIDRWLYVISKDEIPRSTMEDLDPNLSATLSMKMDSYVDFCNKVENLIWLPATRKSFFEGINEIEDMMRDEATTDEMISYLSKLKTYFARLVIIFTVMDMSNMIGIDAIRKSKLLIVYFISTAKTIFTSFENQLTLDKIAKIENASTKKELILAVCKHLPKMNNTAISKFTGCSRQYVINVRQSLQSSVNK